MNALDVLRRLAPDTEAEIARIGSLGNQIFIDTPELERKAFQRDGTITALKMAAFTPADVGETIPDGVPISQAPWALPNGRIIEDQQIIHDAGRFDVWDVQDAVHVSGTSFVDSVSGQRLSVYYANRARVERTTGADLIYYHETRGCFILVQYKKLAACSGEDRWRYYPRDDESIDTELRRLQAVDDTCAALTRPGDDYRLAGQPTWFKFCQEQSVLPSGTDLVPGMYLPRPYLAALLAGKELTGDRGGQVVSYRTVPRYMDNTTFTSLVAGGWVGTSALGTADVHERIRESLARGDDVIYAHGEGHPLKRAEHVAAQRKSSTAKRRGQPAAPPMAGQDTLFDIEGAEHRDDLQRLIGDGRMTPQARLPRGVPRPAETTDIRYRESRRGDGAAIRSPAPWCTPPAQVLKQIARS